MSAESSSSRQLSRNKLNNEQNDTLSIRSPHLKIDRLKDQSPANMKPDNQENGN